MTTEWEPKALGEILRLEYGKPLDAADRNPNGMYPAYGANGEKDRTDKFYRDQSSLIVGRKGSAGEVTLTEERYWPLDVTYFAEFDRQRHDLRFLYYLLKRLDLPSLSKGVKPGINRNEVYALPVKVPSLVQQRRIVAILDEAFEGIATAKANAEKNLQNAQSLPGTAMRTVLESGAPDWIETTIGGQVTLQRGFDITKDQQRPGSVPVVSSGGIRSYHDTAMVKAPGVVMGRKGTLGKVFFLDEDFWPHDTSLWVKDFKGNEPRFVHRFFEVLNVQGLDSGAANPALNRNQVHLIATKWPPLQKQVMISNYMDELVEEAQRLAATYERKLTALDELKKSLLHQAFSGQL